MTSTLTPPRTSSTAETRRPLTLLACTGGAAAAGTVLVTCLGVGVVGWFLADGGIHGEPRDGLRAAATAWLMAHGSGVTIRGVPVTVLPLGLTALCAWVTWRFGIRVGESVSGHGPDADALSDGERDWTVAAATGLFAAAYVLVAIVTGVLAGTTATQPALAPVLLWSLLLTVPLGGTAIAIGSGRASIWMSLAPEPARATAYAAGRMLVTFLLVSTAVLTVALLLDLGAAFNVLSRLHTGTGDAVMFVVLLGTLVPNAVLCAGAYLLGPGFTVGTGTLVSPSVVAIGPVPMFPLLAALPDNGPTPPWTPFLVVVPVLAAGLAAHRAHHRYPTVEWDQGMLRGGVAGVLAGVGFALLAAIAGGAVGPGRMADVGPLVGQVLFHGIVSFGIGGLLGGLLATWLLRRSLGHPDAAVAEPEVDEPAGPLAGVTGRLGGLACRITRRR
jgi:hypothetical protein